MGILGRAGAHLKVLLTLLTQIFFPSLAGEGLLSVDSLLISSGWFFWCFESCTDASRSKEKLLIWIIFLKHSS